MNGNKLNSEINFDTILQDELAKNRAEEAGFGQAVSLSAEQRNDLISRLVPVHSLVRQADEKMRRAQPEHFCAYADVDARTQEDGSVRMAVRVDGREFCSVFARLRGAFRIVFAQSGEQMAFETMPALLETLGHALARHEVRRRRLLDQAGAFEAEMANRLGERRVRFGTKRIEAWENPETDLKECVACLFPVEVWQEEETTPQIMAQQQQLFLDAEPAPQKAAEGGYRQVALVAVCDPSELPWRYRGAQAGDAIDIRAATLDDFLARVLAAFMPQTEPVTAVSQPVI